MSIQVRQWNQAERIRHGIDSGQLTQQETQALRSDQGEIRGVVQQARADGQVDCEERAMIRQLHNQASLDIYEAKHNGKRKPGVPPAPRSPTDTRRIDRREGRQSDRIEKGLSQGDLTQHEARRLVGQQIRIHRAEAGARADGRLTGAERGRIERQQDAASRSIFLARHNSRTAG